MLLAFEAHHPVRHDVIGRIVFFDTDLPEAGHTRKRLQTLAEARNTRLEVSLQSRGDRARANEDHVTANNVPELRQFIDFQVSQVAAHTRHFRRRRSHGMGQHRILVRADAHRADFVGLEALAEPPGALLLVKKRPSRIEFYQHEHKRHQRETGQEHCQRDAPLRPAPQPVSDARAH